MEVSSSVQNSLWRAWRDLYNGGLQTDTTKALRLEQQLAAKAMREKQEARMKVQPRCEVGPYYLDEYDATKVTQVISQQFYNQDLLRYLACNLQIAVSPLPHESGNVLAQERARRWFRRLARIGSKSAFGVVMKSHLDESLDKEALFAIKAPLEENSDEAVNELFITTEGTNFLRPEVPGFAYVYCGFKCSTPIFNNTRYPVKWCLHGQNAQYVVYENITPSVSFRDYMKTATLAQFLPQYLQVLCALRAGIKIGFSHGDLHNENVLVKKLNKILAIPYSLPKGKRYLHTDALSVMIDFGYSRIHVHNEDFGGASTNARYAGIRPDRAFTIGDAYRLFMWSAYSALSDNVRLFKELEPLARFFTSEPLEVHLNNMMSVKLTPFYEERFVNVGLDDLIEFILQTPAGAAVFKDKADATILSCEEGFCLKGEEIPKALLKDPDIPSNLEDFHDRIIYFLEKGNKEAALETLATVNLSALFLKHEEEYNNLLEFVLQRLGRLSWISLERQSYLLQDFLSQYMYQIAIFVSLVADVDQMEYFYYLLEWAHKFSAVASLPLPPKPSPDIRTSLGVFKSALAKDINVALAFVKTNEYNVALGRFPSLSWYQETLLHLGYLVE